MFVIRFTISSIPDVISISLINIVIFLKSDAKVYKKSVHYIGNVEKTCVKVYETLQKNLSITSGKMNERDTGVEPASQAWEARALPMC